MAGPERALPYRDVFWANTQKHTISAYHDRWLLIGATIGKDDELSNRPTRSVGSDGFGSE